MLAALDLEGEAPQVAGVQLDRARLRLVYLQCDDPVRCDEAKQAWQDAAIRANAADVTFADPSAGLAGLEAS